MAVQKVAVFDQTSAELTELTPNTSSAGSGDAGKLVALDTSGHLDVSLLPTGIGGTALSLPAAEAIAAGAQVNIFNNSGVASMRNANATDATKPAHAFVNAAVASGATGTAYGPGQLITGLSGLTPGQMQFLSTTAGGITTTAPSTAGNLVQQIGAAVSATSVLFQPQTVIVRG